MYYGNNREIKGAKLKKTKYKSQYKKSTNLHALK